jgi:hypothetical protein
MASAPVRRICSLSMVPASPVGDVIDIDDIGHVRVEALQCPSRYFSVECANSQLLGRNSPTTCGRRSSYQHRPCLRLSVQLQALS